MANDKKSSGRDFESSFRGVLPLPFFSLSIPLSLFRLEMKREISVHLQSVRTDRFQPLDRNKKKKKKTKASGRASATE